MFNKKETKFNIANVLSLGVNDLELDKIKHIVDHYLIGNYRRE